MATLFIALFLIFSASLEAIDDKGHILYLLSKGNVNEAMVAFQSLKKGEQSSLIEEMGLHLLFDGIRSSDKETQLYALVGSSISMSQKAEKIYEMGFESPHIEVQAASLSAIAKTGSQHARFLIERGIGHAHPLVRLQSALLMAELRLPGAVSRIESLMEKFPGELHFFFADFFAEINDASSLRLLKKLINAPHAETRIGAIGAIGRFQLESLMPEARSRLHQPDFKEQEVALWSLYVLKDEAARIQIERLTNSRHPSIKLLAHAALLKMGDRQHELFLLEEVSNGNPFAIPLVKECPKAIALLEKMAPKSTLGLKINILPALVDKKSRDALLLAEEILALDLDKKLIFPLKSPGGTLKALKVIDSASTTSDDKELLLDFSLLYKEEILTALASYSDDDFIKISRPIIQRDDKEMIPLAIALLKNLGTPKTISYLLELEQKAGSPYTRALSTLALVSVRKEGYTIDKVRKWLLSDTALQSLDLKLATQPSDSVTSYEVSPQERSRLFIEALLTLVQENPESAVNLIVEMIGRAPPKIRPLLGGLLLKAAE